MSERVEPLFELAALAAQTPSAPPDDFDEAAYLSAFPDIAAAIARGQWQSAYQHFREHGLREGRLLDPRYVRALAGEAIDRDEGAFPACGVDAVFVAPDGHCFVVGWIDDRFEPLRTLVLLNDRGNPAASTQHIARRRRADAEEAIGAHAGHLLGFWAIVASSPGAFGPECKVLVRAGNGRRSFNAQTRPVAMAAFRDIVFEYLAASPYFGNPAVESFLQLDGGAGGDLIALNLTISAQLKSGVLVKRFGPRRRFRGSIVVCLYGKPEFLFLQAGLFSACRGIDDYEFVYVSNSPELTERLQKEAQLAAQIYGLSLTMVFLPGNAGFGAANNVAVEHAQSDRVLITNPDVFPRDSGWAETHGAIIGGLRPEQTRLFGAPLFYDDGSLMHAGMFFEFDTGLSVRPDGIVERSLIRVEHYAKGAPADCKPYRRSRTVPAITGAFMSVDRAWYETLGGFSEEYVFGHYEDADLCLKSRVQGCPVWIHDLPMWHLEGKGSTRRQAHEGGSLVNRWHFTGRWKDLIAAELTGAEPGSALAEAAGA